MLEKTMKSKAQLLRDMAADNLRGHRNHRKYSEPFHRELADWYEGKYLAYKRASEMILTTLEIYE